MVLLNSKLWFLHLSLLMGFIAFNGLLQAQNTKINGIVKDSVTGELLPFVNIVLEGTKVGSTSGFEGEFSINTPVESRFIVVSYVGYLPRRIPIKAKSYQSITILLRPNNIELSEVVIIPGENPAHKILRNVIKNKPINDSRSIESYKYKTYNKIQIDANNITDDFKNSRRMQPFAFAFENMDTSTINGKPYLPLFITESISEVYFNKNPEQRKETIIASRATGVNNSSVAKFTGNLYQTFSLYDNYMQFFDKHFVSPIADFGLRAYKYYLIDSAFIGSEWCYKIMFKPRRLQEPTFVGEMWITDTTFAVKSIEMKINEVNLNFINAMSVLQSFVLVENKYWMVDREAFIIDANITENPKRITGFFGHKTTLYQDFNINKPQEENAYKKSVDVVTKEDAWTKNNEYWDSVRFEPLSQEEQGIYTLTDSIFKTDAYKKNYKLISTLVSGYIPNEIFEIGQYYTFFSFNGVEGYRFKLGGRTSNQLNDKIRLSTYIAYGTKDYEFKYNLGVKYVQNREPWRSLEVEYKKDMEQLGESVRSLQQDNLINSIFRRAPNDKLTMVEQYKASYEHEYFPGLSNTVTFRRRNIFPLTGIQFLLKDQGEFGNITAYNNIITSEIELLTHFSLKEVFITDKFNRTSLGSNSPTINFWYAYGIPNFLGSQFGYHRIQIGYSDYFNVGSIGASKIILSYGKIWGQLPYPLLEIHPGNETFTYDNFAFSRMYYYEFISDDYIMANYSHYFQGLFFNHIPLIRKLKWREVIYTKVLIGKMSHENQYYSNFPSNTTFMTKPYYEVGVAIENIFKVIRIDASWRLSYLDKPGVRPFGLTGTMKFDF